jgi:hypothetical protein
MTLEFGSFWSQLLHGECGQDIFKWSRISEVDLQLSKSTAAGKRPKKRDLFMR